jgi:hypothetical protein
MPQKKSLPHSLKQFSTESPRERLLSNSKIITILRLIGWISACALLAMSRSSSAIEKVNPPVLISEATTTRAVALESVTFLREPFSPVSSLAWSDDRRTRVMLFAMNLKLQPDEDLSVVTADAEDASHQHYDLKVEYVGPVPSQEWISAVVLRLNDNLGDVGDVLVRVAYRGVNSNRVRVGIGHLGGGPPDDDGATPTPAPPYTISGQVKSGAQGFGGVSVVLSGAQTAIALTNENGFYSFTVNAVGDYTLTPSKTNYNFSPASQSFSNLSYHQNNVNFTGTPQTYTVSGLVQDDHNQGLDGINVTLADANGVILKSSVTGGGGKFSFVDVVPGYIYIVRAANNSFFTFAPQNTNLLNGDFTLNFTGTRRTYSIIGKVTGKDGDGLSGVTVNLSGAQSASQITDNNGNYSFAGLPAGVNYTLTPSQTDIYDFTAQSFNNLANSQTANFTGTLRTFTLSGHVANGASGASGVTVTLSGSQAATTTTDANGNYSFANVTVTGNYTLTPSKKNYTFTPTAQSFNNLSGAQTANFEGALNHYVLSGRITDAQNNGLGNATLTLSGSQTATVQADASGNYSFTVLAEGNYTITPSKQHYLFNPSQQSFNNLGGDQKGDFNAALRQYIISGRATEASGLALRGITVNLSGGQTGTTKTGSDGSYTFSATALGNYTVTPSSPKIFTFAPQDQNFTPLESDRSNVGFIGTRELYTVSGRVLDDRGSGVDGVPATLTNANDGSSQTTVTSNGGAFSFTGVPAGFSYSVSTPSTYILSYTPKNIDELSDNVVLNLAATRVTYGIAGVITDTSQHGLEGVTVKLTGGSSDLTTITNSDGVYGFDGLPSGEYFSVTPMKADYVFSPATRQIYTYTSQGGINFTALKSYTVSGRVLNGTGQGLGGITLTLDGPQKSAVKTASDGNYSLTVTATGNYALIPSIEQDYYAFSPPNQSFDTSNGNKTANFTATLKPFSNPSSVLEFDGSPKTVDYGNFWEPGINLGHFYWEFWAMPGSNAGGSYLLSDGYGGAHALLFGFGNYNFRGSKSFQLFGNIFDGVLDVSHITYFGGDQGPAVGEWGHFAVGWDGKNVITYYNGVPVGKVAFVGPRQTAGPGGGGGGRLLIGGSDHNNLDGRIAQVRGYEDSNPREDLSGGGGTEAAFAPQTVFGLGGNLLSYYFRPAPAVADLSRGYNGSTHTGYLRGTTAGVLYDCGSCPPPQFVIDSSAPNFIDGTPQPPVLISTPAPVPGGALVFDSFSRANSTYIFSGAGGLGSTEGGAAEAQVWQSNEAASGLKPFGILNGLAVLLANGREVAWVPTNSATGNLDIRVERNPGIWGSGVDTGLSFRVTDADNYFFAYSSESAQSPGSQTLTVGYYLNGQRNNLVTGVSMPANWTTLRVVTTATGSINVYADATLLYSASNNLMATVTGAGLYNDSSGLGLVNRWDNFTVYDAP